MIHRLAQEQDWEAEGGEAVGLLQGLLRFDTSNPPGDETACAEFAAERLRQDGIEPELLAAAGGRANVVARLRGEGGEPPLMLAAHLDVVPADAERWTHPPFGGEVHDGFVWGRGAVDMKNMAAMSLAVMGMLARSGARLRRDVVFAGVADEENGCGQGSAWLVAEHPEKVAAGFVLGEVGGFTLHVGDTAIYPVQVAEKGAAWIRAVAHGTSGHGSMPRDDNPVVRLGAFLDKVGRTRLPVHSSAVVERFLRDLAATQGPAAQRMLPLVAHPRLSTLVTDRLIRDPALARTLRSLVRNTASPTMLRAGSRTNVIPGRAEADIDGRIAVGSDIQTLMRELRDLAGEHIELELVGSHPPHSASADTELFSTIAAVVADHHPGARAVPNVIPGFTDAQYWSRTGAVCYGFSPVRLERDGPDFFALFHGDDERIPVEGFKAGLRMLADAVFRFCVA